MTFTPPPTKVFYNKYLSTLGDEGMGVPNAAVKTAQGALLAWPAANRIIYCPLELERPVTIDKFWWSNGAVAGNVLMGLYNAITLAKVVDIPSTVMAGATTTQEVDITGTKVASGRYYIAQSASTITTATFTRSAVSLQFAKAFGVAEENAGTFALPATATLVAHTVGYVPVSGIIIL